MPRLKTLSILAGLIAALAVSATPASAWWESKNGQPDGTIEVNKAGHFAYEAGASITCIPKEIKAQWQIQTKGQIKTQGQEIEEKQKPTLKGPHLQIQVKSWGTGCTAEIGGIKAAATVGECNFQLQQQEKSLKATAAGAKGGCLIKASVCTIQVWPGMESQPGSGKGINVGLKEIELSNSGNNQVDKGTVTTGGVNQKGEEKAGIVANASGVLCPLGTKSETGTLTEFEFTVIGANAV